MPNTMLQSDRVALARLRRKQRVENERRDRIFDDRERTIGIDKEALDKQIKEKKEQDEAQKAQKKAFESELQQNSRRAWLLERKEARDRQEVARATCGYWHQQQQHLQNRADSQEDDGSTELSIPGLVGIDREYMERQQRQKVQLREWLTQQQSEKAAEREKEKLERQQNDQNRVAMDRKVMQLHVAMMDTKRALAVATKDFNQLKVEEKGQRGQLDDGEEPRPSVVGVPGLTAKSDWKPPPETQQQVIEFRKCQAEERKTMELERRREKERADLDQINLGRTALLLERQQARMNKTLRQQLDSTNAQLAQIQKEQMPDIKRGQIDDTFFSFFNTCSR